MGQSGSKHVLVQPENNKFLDSMMVLSKIKLILIASCWWEKNFSMLYDVILRQPVKIWYGKFFLRNEAITSKVSEILA